MVLYKILTFSNISSIVKAPLITRAEQLRNTYVQTGEPWMDCRVIRHCPLVGMLEHTHARALRTRAVGVTLYTWELLQNKEKRKRLKLEWLIINVVY